MSMVSYNSDDPAQTAFLQALQGSETGPGATGVTAFNIAPSTWDTIASEFNLSLGTTDDQNEGAWYLAEQTFAQQTGGQSLETALQNGDYSSIQSALSSIWPNVTGSEGAPSGLAASLANLAGTQDAAMTANTNATTATPGTVGTASAPAPSSTGFFGNIGILLIGAIIILVAGYFLLKGGK